MRTLKDVPFLKNTLENPVWFTAAFEAAAVGMVVEDSEGRLLQSNPAFRRMLGYEEGELQGRLRRDLTYSEDVEGESELYSEFLRGGRDGFQTEKRYVKKGGGIFWGRLSVSRIEGFGTASPLTLGVVEDISELKRAEAALGTSERRFRMVVEQSPLSIHVFAPDGRSIRANDSWNQLWYLGGGEEPEGANVFEDDQLRTAGLLPYVKDGVAGIGRKIPPLLFDPARVGREGEPRWLEGVVYPLRSTPEEITEVTLMLEDVTERKALEERMAYQALHDSLTNLPNRTLFLDRLSQAFARLEHRTEQDDTGQTLVPARVSRRNRIAVLLLDLDDLKRVNDSLGHEAGDNLLVEVAGRLGKRLGPSDTLARLAGDEFAVLLEEVNEEEATRTAERVARGIEVPFTVADQEVFVSASFGIALSGTVGPVGQPARHQADLLLRHAGLAIHEAKKQGKARHVLYEEQMEEEAGGHLKLERDLRYALERQEIEVHYQPKISLASGRAAGVEALARWRHPERGLVLPAGFIGLAEKTGLIVELGYQVLRTALEQARKWQEPWQAEEGESPPVVWVNLSARQFHEPDLASRISGILAETGVRPDALGLEITESILVENAGRSVSLLEDLRRLGVKLAVDDFGTGYSSLSYLTRLPVDYLKIDRSFVSEIGPATGNDPARAGAKSATVVSAVIGLARALGMKVVAEGVETGAQLSCLRGLGCDLVQGYYFAQPLPVEEASAYLADQTTTSG